MNGKIYVIQFNEKYTSGQLMMHYFDRKKDAHEWLRKYHKGNNYVSGFEEIVTLTKWTDNKTKTAGH